MLCILSWECAHRWHFMTQACTRAQMQQCIKRQRCLDIACINNVQDLNKHKTHTMPWFILYTYTHLVRSLEVVLVDYQHYFNAYELVVSTFYVVGRLYWAVFISGITPRTSAWPTPSQPQISSNPYIITFFPCEP